MSTYYFFFCFYLQKVFGGSEALGVLDGDYFMCLDDKFDVKKNNCLVMSFGINNEWSFDDAVDKKLGCKVSFIEK